jgi:hypothetical protein
MMRMLSRNSNISVRKYQEDISKLFLERNPPTVICTFQATETITCPAGVIPTEEGE